MTTQVLRGCYPAVITAFSPEGNRYNHPVNYNGVDRVVEHVLRGGVDGVVVAGCTGAASVLSHDEQVKLVKYVNENFGKRTTVIAGDGSNSTYEAVELAKRMEGDAGVFTHLSISPYYNKPSDRGMYEHFEAIADRIEGGLILYSVPGRTGGKGIMPDVASKLADHPHIIGIKEASGDYNRIRKTIELTEGKEFFVISGDDGLTFNIIKAGGTGVISVAANVAPRQMSDMVYFGFDTDGVQYDVINKLNSDLEELYSALFPKSKEGNPSPNPVMCHYALNRMGLDVGVPRLPLTEGEPEEMTSMDNALRKLRLIK